MSLVATQLGMLDTGNAQPLPKELSAKAGGQGSFESLKQIDGGVLSVGYAETGLVTGPTVMLLHGWPYDIYSFVDATPILASRGYRVIVPHTRATAARDSCRTVQLELKGEPDRVRDQINWPDGTRVTSCRSELDGSGILSISANSFSQMSSRNLA